MSAETTTASTPTVFAAFSDVMEAVQSIRKKDRNAQQGFNFRGIDATMNAVGPALRAHGVVIIPTGVEITAERYETKGNTVMKNTTVKMQYTVYGPSGDSFVGSAFGEAADAGDKSVSKAQSVAYRTFLLQGLTIPTEERDPDAETHERVAQSPADEARTTLRSTLKFKNIDPQAAVEKFAADNDGELKDSDDVEAIRALIQHYRSQAVTA